MSKHEITKRIVELKDDLGWLAVCMRLQSNIEVDYYYQRYCSLSERRLELLYELNTLCSKFGG